MTNGGEIVLDGEISSGGERYPLRSERSLLAGEYYPPESGRYPLSGNTICELVGAIL